MRSIKAFVIGVLVLTLAGFAAAQVTQKKIVTIGPGEIIVSGESVLPSVYFNGTLLREFPERVDKESFWIDDAKHYAWLGGEKIRFSDGTEHPYPIMIRHARKDGKTSLGWISLQKNGDVVAYRRTL